MRFNYQAAALRVCLDDRNFSGRIVGQRVSKPIYFSDINDFMVQVDALLDVQKFPRAFQKIRSFTEKEQPEVPAVLSQEQLRESGADELQWGKYATFTLLIRTRQSASWQGQVDWLDGQPPQPFESTLEVYHKPAIPMEGCRFFHGPTSLEDRNVAVVAIASRSRLIMFL